MTLEEMQKSSRQLEDLSRLEPHVTPLKPGRNFIAGHPVDIEDQEPSGGLEMRGVDQAAATGAIKHMRAQGFRVKRHNDHEFRVQHESIKAGGGTLTEWLVDLAADAHQLGLKYTHSKRHPDGRETHVFGTDDGAKTLVINDGPELKHKTWQMYDKGKQVDQGAANVNQDWWLDRTASRLGVPSLDQSAGLPHRTGPPVPAFYGGVGLKYYATKRPYFKESRMQEDAAPQGKKPNGYEPPGLPKTTNPADVHDYYMAMATYHDKHAWKHQRLSGLKPLWSDDRNMHQDRHSFHKAMRDGFAQKALSVDLAAAQESQSGFGGKGMRESVESGVLQVSDRTVTLEQFTAQHGVRPLELLREDQIQFRIVVEAFSGASPTGALDTINQNHTSGSKPLPLNHPFPSQVPKPAVKNLTKKVPGVIKPTESNVNIKRATEAVARGANPFDVLSAMSASPLNDQKVNEMAVRLFHPGQKVKVGQVDTYGYCGREQHPPTDGSLEGATGHVTGYGDLEGLSRYTPSQVGKAAIRYGVEPVDGPDNGPHFQSVMVHIKDGPHKGRSFQMVQHELEPLA